jgi:hypothetical protein
VEEYRLGKKGEGRIGLRAWKGEVRAGGRALLQIALVGRPGNQKEKDPGEPGAGIREDDLGHVNASWPKSIPILPMTCRKCSGSWRTFPVEMFWIAAHVVKLYGRREAFPSCYTFGTRTSAVLMGLFRGIVQVPFQHQNRPCDNWQAFLWA